MGKIINIYAVMCVIVSGIAANSISTDESTCPLICPALYSPVCATDGNIFKEFSNDCELKTVNCRRERSAAQTYAATDMAWCSSEAVENLTEKFTNLDLEATHCLKPCALIYAPVCVSNGKWRGVLSNECVMEMFNCALSAMNNDVPSVLFRVLRKDHC